MNIEQVSYYVSFAAFVIVIVSWFAFAAGFFLRKKPQTSPDAVKAPKSWAGLALQGISYAPVWAAQRRPMFSNFVPNDIANMALQAFAVF